MKTAIIFLTGILMIFTACKKDKTDTLSGTEILGKWEIYQRSVNGISSAAVVCCEFLEFSLDENGSDLIGNYIASSSGSQVQGVFEINDDHDIINFYGNDTLICGYIITASDLQLEYTINGDLYNEGWMKQ